MSCRLLVRSALFLMLACVVGAAGAEDPPPPADAEANAVALDGGGGPVSEENPETIHIKASPEPRPGRLLQMAAWHRRYSAGMAATKQSWLQLLQSIHRMGPDEPHPLRELATRCTVIRRAVSRLATDQIFPVPDPAVDIHLQRAVGSLRGAAAVCDARRFFLLTYRLEQAESAFREAARLMGPYRIAP